VLPRLETALPHLPADTKFLINRNAKQWQLDSLGAFGIGADRLEIQPGGIHTRVERLWFATPLGHSSLGSGQVIRQVSNRLRLHFTDDDSKRESRRRLYISRRKTAHRRVVNESEISLLLEDHGFETVLCEDMSLGEQVRIFAKTPAVIGAHGAGLTNLIYCSPGSFVGEIHVNGVPPAYLVMSRQLGMRFSRFEAKLLTIDRVLVGMRADPRLFGEWICGWFGSSVTRGVPPGYSN
jgi:capsular polysaccharide biosynthesis protein